MKHKFNNHLMPQLSIDHPQERRETRWLVLPGVKLQLCIMTTTIITSSPSRQQQPNHQYPPTSIRIWILEKTCCIRTEWFLGCMFAYNHIIYMLALCIYVHVLILILALSSVIIWHHQIAATTQYNNPHLFWQRRASVWRFLMVSTGGATWWRLQLNEVYFYKKSSSIVFKYAKVLLCRIAQYLY